MLVRVCSEWPQADPVSEHSVGNKMMRFSEVSFMINVNINLYTPSFLHTKALLHPIKIIPHQAAVRFPQDSSGLKRMDSQSMF